MSTDGDGAESIRVLIADGDTLVRDGLASILAAQAAIDVVGRASDGREAVELCRDLRVDVALLALAMPRVDGLAALAELRETQPAVAVVMLTTFDSEPRLAEALALGAAGFMVTSSSFEDLVAAVRAAHAGDPALSPTALRRHRQGG